MVSEKKAKAILAKVYKIFHPTTNEIRQIIQGYQIATSWQNQKGKKKEE